MDYSKLDQEAVRELLQGKKVAIIGYKKSAIDLAMECAEANQGIYNIKSHPKSRLVILIMLKTKTLNPVKETKWSTWWELSV